MKTYPAGKDPAMKHLTFDDRVRIQRALTIGRNFTEIAAEIGKDRSTVSREIRNNFEFHGKKTRSSCIHKCIFDDPSDCPAPYCKKSKCSIACSQCAPYCDRYESAVCSKLTRPPYVCNGCADRANCMLTKRMYNAEFAQKKYRNGLRESREGISLSENDIQHIEETIIPLIKQGISLPTAYDAFADSMPVSIKTIYNYISKGVFSIGNIDLRRTVQRKPYRKKSGPVLHIDKRCHVGRTYADFQLYLKEHPGINVCEMDTVEGKKGGKVILTIFFRNCDLQLMYLRSANTAKSVTEIFRHLRRTLGARYREIFPLVLTDRGSEFTDPQSIELDTRTLETVTRMFYCDPLQTNQKSRCERNHEYIRYIIPQSTALDPFSQEEIRNVMNHVNSMPRPGLNGKTPYDVFVSIYGQDIAGILGLEGIPLDKLCLKPALLKKTTK